MSYTFLTFISKNFTIKKLKFLNEFGHLTQDINRLNVIFYNIKLYRDLLRILKNL